MTTVLLLSGPNLNMLGAREPEVYGSATLDDHVATATATAKAHGLELEHLQSAAEADLVAAVLGARERCAAIIVNPGALTHYGWSLHDALAMFAGVVVELHSRIRTRVSRGATRRSISPVATGTVVGFRGHGYALAVEAVARLLQESS